MGEPSAQQSSLLSDKLFLGCTNYIFADWVSVWTWAVTQSALCSASHDDDDHVHYPSVAVPKFVFPTADI
jgi:hypothetical protein